MFFAALLNFIKEYPISFIDNRQISGRIKNSFIKNSRKADG